MRVSKEQQTIPSSTQNSKAFCVDSNQHGTTTAMKRSKKATHLYNVHFFLLPGFFINYFCLSYFISGRKMYQLYVFHASFIRLSRNLKLFNECCHKCSIAGLLLWSSTVGAMPCYCTATQLEHSSLTIITDWPRIQPWASKSEVCLSALQLQWNCLHSPKALIGKSIDGSRMARLGSSVSISSVICGSLKITHLPFTICIYFKKVFYKLEVFNRWHFRGILIKKL